MIEVLAEASMHEAMLQAHETVKVTFNIDEIIDEKGVPIPPANMTDPRESRKAGRRPTRIPEGEAQTHVDPGRRVLNPRGSRNVGTRPTWIWYRGPACTWIPENAAENTWIPESGKFTPLNHDLFHY